MATRQVTRSRSAAVEFANQFIDTWNGHKLEALLEMLTDDVVWMDPNLAEPVKGHTAVREFLLIGLRAFPDLRFREAEPQHASVDGQTIAHAWVMEGTMLGALDPPGFLPTGKHFSVEGIDLWTMREGKIAVYRSYYDTARIARHLGLMPAEGSRAERATVSLQRMQSRLRPKPLFPMLPFPPR